MYRTLLSSSLAFLAATVLMACSKKEEAATSSAPAVATAKAIVPITASADVKPFSIGTFQAAALKDGGLSVPNDNKTLAINKTKADVEALLKENGLASDQLQLSVQPLIVKTADKVLLFDTGSASLYGPENGKLPASMKSAGIDPSAVTDIFISHGHGDHVAGLVSNNALAFPNAAVHIQTAEWNSLKSQKEMETLVAVVAPKVVEFQPDADLVPGVKAVDIKGHTPGHSGYLITSGDQSLLYIGDTMHHSVISVQQPNWTIAFDGDAPIAEASRRQLIESAAASGQRIFAVHFPFPGLGKIRRQGDKYVWEAE